MSSATSTLSSHSVVLDWLKDHADGPFPTEDFTKAISHDLQGSHVLLRHIGHVTPVWTHGLPSTHRRRHQLYVGDLRPRLAKDLKRVERLIAFVDWEVQVFCCRSSRLSHRDNSVTADLLRQLKATLQHLLSRIDCLPNDQPATSEPEPVKVSRQHQDHTGQVPTAWRLERAGTYQPEKRVRFVGVLQAQKISLIKPQQAPALVTQCRHTRCTCKGPHCQYANRTPSPVSRVDSAMSIR